MITFLQVPFSEKDEARRLGAKWNPARKLWYIENVEDMKPFLRWIDPSLLECSDGAQFVVVKV